MTVPVVITGVGLVCPAASSVADLLAAGNGGGRAGALDDQTAWFDPVSYLGPHGWKYLTPATRYVLAAAGLALTDAGIDPKSAAPETMGVIVGTNFAARPVVAGMGRVVIDHGADELRPAEAPNFSVNIPASQVSLRWAMRAFNLSLTNPMVAGVESLVTLTSVLRRGRARMGIAGAVEQFPGDEVHPAAAEGACCFTVELLPDVRRRDGVAYAEVVGGFSQFVPQAPRDCWAELDSRLGELCGSVGDGPLPYVFVPGRSAADRDIDEFCTRRLVRAGADVVRCAYLGAGGDHFTVSPLLQVAGLVAERGGGMVVAASPHGHVAGVLLRPVQPKDAHV